MAHGKWDDIRRAKVPPEQEASVAEGVRALHEFVSVTCDFDVHGAPCYLWVGHYGLHRSEGHDTHCAECGQCGCDRLGDCWVEEAGEDEMVAVRLPRHRWVKDR